MSTNTEAVAPDSRATFRAREDAFQAWLAAPHHGPEERAAWRTYERAIVEHQRASAAYAKTIEGN